MFTTIITDCYGENEKGRQIARYNSLELGPSDLIGVSSNFGNDATIEGGANLIDILDATEGKKGVVILNIAPRGDKNEGTNGNRFCYFYVKDTLIISTVKGYCLSFIKEFDLIKSVNVMELKDVLDFALKQGLIDQEQSKYIVKTQFRSFDFIPRLARWLIDGVKIPSTVLHLTTYNLPPSCIWHIDAFGNAKLTITNADLGSSHPEIFSGSQSNQIPKQVRNDKKSLTTNLGTFPFYERLKDIPHGKTAIYIGSSGIGDRRFLELATQGIPGSVSKNLKLKVGDKIDII